MCVCVCVEFFILHGMPTNDYLMSTHGITHPETHHVSLQSRLYIASAVAMTVVIVVIVAVSIPGHRRQRHGKHSVQFN